MPWASFAYELPVAADTHVASPFPDLNFGTSPFLSVGGGTRAYLRFDTSSLPPGVVSSPGARVNLVLWVGQAGGSGTLQVSNVAGAWTEAGLTWNNQPTQGSAVGSVS